MARWKSNNPKAGRTAPTPKPGAAGDDDRTAGRYTPPTVRPEDQPSEPWVPIAMAVLFAVGLLLIIVNYLEWWPGSPSG